MSIPILYNLYEMTSECKPEQQLARQLGSVLRPDIVRFAKPTPQSNVPASRSTWRKPLTGSFLGKPMPSGVAGSNSGAAGGRR